MKRTIQSICGIFIIAAIMVVTMASLCQEEAHASESMLPRNVHWEGTTAVWDIADYEDNYLTQDYLEYEAALFNVTNGTDELIGTYYTGKNTSKNLESVINSLNITGDKYILSLRVRTINTRVSSVETTEYVSADPITLHKICFDSMGGTPVSDMIAIKGNTHSFPEDPTKNGFAFAGWYKKDNDFENEPKMWDFERDKVESNMTLYAKWIEDGKHVHSVGGSNVSFKPWTRIKSLPTAGNYYLLYDVDLAYDANITGKVNLCLAGHTVTCRDRQIKVKDGGSLDLLDPEEGGKITGSTNLSGAIHVEGGEFTMHSGSITGNRAFSYGNDPGQGGAIRVSSGSAKMLGGSITNNVAGEIGGAVAVKGGSFELAGGTISGNKAGERDGPAAGGAAVGVSNGASFIMSGGLITGNETVGSQTNGSAIHVREGTFYVSGGTITGNSGNSAVFINVYYGGSMQIAKDGSKTGVIKISDNPGGNLNVYGTSTIKVNGEIDETSEIRVIPHERPKQGQFVVITDGLNGKGDVSIFKSDYDDYTVVDAGNGEAAFKNYWKLSYKAGDHSSGGEMEPSQIRIVDEENFTFPECGYLPENGYEFAGWKVDNNTYQKDDTLKITGHRDVTATWTKVGPDDPIPEPGSDPSQTGTDGTPVGPGASAAAADKAITSMANDKDPKGAVFGKLKLQSTRQTKTAVTLRWTKQSGAKTYVVYGNKCGKGNKPQKLATVTGSTYNCQKLKKGIYYKFIVVALDQNNNVISTSKLIHVATKGGKVGNYKKVTVTKTVIKKAKALRKGRKLRIKAKAVVQSKRLKVKKHIGLRYESTNTAIATVSAKGVITAKKKGTCFVYIYAQNGVYKRIKVKVA